MRPSEGWFFSWVGVTFAVMIVWIVTRFGCLHTVWGSRCYDFVGSLAFLQWPLIALLQMLLLLRFRRDAWQWGAAIATAGLIGCGLDHLTWTVPALGRLEVYAGRLSRPLDMAGVWAWQWGLALIEYLLIGLAGILVLSGWRWNARVWMVGMILLGTLVTPASMVGIAAVPATPDNSWGGPFSSMIALVSGIIVSLVVSFGTALAIRETMRRTPMSSPLPPPPMPVWR